MLHLLSPGLMGQLSLGLTDIVQHTVCEDDPGEVLSDIKAGSEGMPEALEVAQGALDQGADLA